jgi:hypothetical protein
MDVNGGKPVREWQTALTFLGATWAAGHLPRFPTDGTGFLGGHNDFLRARAAMRGAGRDIFSFLRHFANYDFSGFWRFGLGLRFEVLSLVGLLILY